MELLPKSIKVMEEMHAEYEQVNEKIKMIESEIMRLLQKKNKLLERKTELKNSIKRLENQVNTPNEQFQYDNVEFPWSNSVLEVLSSVFKLKTFRSMQLQTINATLSGKDCILVLPTGGGKSLCYQLPALVDTCGFTLVISPLLSLIEDQLHSLQLLNISSATLNSQTNRSDAKMVMASMVNDKSAAEEVRLIYVTPEKLAKSKTFMSKLEKAYSFNRLKRIAIDEVHCCSQWGHDFRPDYKFLGVMKRQFPGVPIIGLTATATSRVLNDVEKMLNIPSCLVFRASYNRKNLYYGVIEKPSNSSDAMVKLATVIKEHYPGQSGIVYCLSQKDSEEVAGALCSHSISSSCYHASMNGDARKHIHMKWIRGKIQVIVATVAFGMGIDKPNVRFVIHYSPSKSLENYYQESGRAGRDDENSDCILMFKAADAYRLSTMVFSDQNGLENLYLMLRYCIMSDGCRRSLVASHFNETWSAADCANLCDLCQRQSNKSKVTSVNLSELYKTILQIIDEQKLKPKQPRITALKLLDILKMSKYEHIVRSYVKHAAREKHVLLENFILYLILESYLTEDFHFTPYATISYVAAGPRSIEDNPNIPFTVLQKEESSRTSSNFSGRNVKPSIVNPDNSKIVSDKAKDYGVVSLKKRTSCNTDQLLDGNDKPDIKRQCTVISLIDDDDDLDFGDGGMSSKV